MKNPHKLFTLALLLLVGMNSISAQEVLSNQSIISLVIAKVSNSIIISKIKSSDNNFDLSSTGIINLKENKVQDIIIDEMLPVTNDLPEVKNEDVISMQTKGVSKKIILKKINLSPCKFNTNTESLIALNNAKVPEEITKVMMDPATSTSLASKNLTSAKLAQHPQEIPPPKTLTVSGIYYEAFQPKVEYIALEPSTTNQTKQGGIGEAMGNRYTMGMTGTSTKVGLANQTANMVIEDAQPVFYFLLERDGKSIDEVRENTSSGVASPNDFVLVRVKVAKNGRMVEIGRKTSYGNESGFNSGTIPFRFKKVSEALYKVYFEKEVPAGEYAFYYNKGSDQSKGLKLFDFSLRNNITVTK